MAIIFIRTVVFYLITIIALRIMGKRQIGELEPTELVVTIMISELATMPIQDIDAPLVNSALAIFTLVTVEILISVLSMKSSLVRKMVSGKYSILIDEGKINVEEMRRIQLTVEELMEELRKEGVLSPASVRYCILETGGNMSVFTKKDVKEDTLPLVLVSDGKVINKNLKMLDLSRKKLEATILEKYGMDINDLFMLLYSEGEFTAVNSKGEVCGC